MNNKNAKFKHGRVTAAYHSPYTEPWFMTAGEKLGVISKPSEWEGWVWCIKPDGTSRWVPESYVHREGDHCVAQRDYESTELSVEVGELLSLGEKESDWFWCTNQQGRSGWVPAENIELFKEKA